MRRALQAAWLVLALSIAGGSVRAADAGQPPPPVVVVGSKAFTESVILGEITSAALRGVGVPAEHRRELGGTRVLWTALRSGEIDTYAEYTGTLLREVLSGEPQVSEATLAAALARHGIGIAARLGFDNSYVLGMREDRAAQLQIESISDLRAHPLLKFGLSNEFLDRTDGWPGLRAAYHLPQDLPRGLQHDLAYRGIESGAVDVIDLYATDAEIQHYGLRRLVDDLGYFPRYEAVLLYRFDLPAPALAALRQLDGRIDTDTMAGLNAQSRLERRPEPQIAAQFLREHLDVQVTAAVDGRARRVLDRSLEHLTLVAVSLSLAIALAIPLGILAYLRPRVGAVVLAATAIVQTVPALALLVFMIPWFGIGVGSAIAALFLYGLLPIVRNTHAGLRGLPADVRDSAIVLGLPTYARLARIELPLAAPTILAGIKTAAVINVGTATLGALIGAGGYGEPILSGIRLDDLGLIFEGAVPAALLALLVQGAFELAERVWFRREPRAA